MPTALQAIGYKEVAGHLLGAYGLEEALERDIRAVKAYAKRQYTWFRHEPGDVVYLPRGARRPTWASGTGFASTSGYSGGMLAHEIRARVARGEVSPWRWPRPT